MNTIKTLLTAAFRPNTTNKVVACDFFATHNEQTIYYNITSSTPPLTVEVTKGNENPNSYRGEVIIPDTVLHNGDTYTVIAIGNNAFANCSGLTSITIPNSVLTIGDYAFDGCTHLTSVVIPDSVTDIGEGAFTLCHGLTSVVIPHSITTIKAWSFAGCTGLTSITIPHSVTAIEGAALFDCIHLKEIHVKATTPPQIRRFIFEEILPDTSVYVCGEVEEYKKSYDWRKFAHILSENDYNIQQEVTD